MSAGGCFARSESPSSSARVEGVGSDGTGGRWWPVPTAANSAGWSMSRARRLHLQSRGNGARRQSTVSQLPVPSTLVAVVPELKHDASDMTAADGAVRWARVNCSVSIRAHYAPIVIASRASASQAEGREFEPRLPLQPRDHS